jgi:head-tail adaptor
MNPGELNKRISILHKKYPTETSENGFPLESQEAVMTVWSSVNISTEKALFTIRYRKSIVKGDKIQYNGRTFDIIDINDPNEKHRELVITAMEVTG